MAGDCTHPFLCCEPTPCCTHRLINSTPSVVWSRPETDGGCVAINAIATDGSNLYLAYSNRVQKWDNSGNLVWDEHGGTGALPITALTATSGTVWAAAAVDAPTLTDPGALYVSHIAASDGSVDWTTTVDTQTGANARVFALANDGTDVYTAGTIVEVGADTGLGVRIDSTGAVVGVYGIEPFALLGNSVAAFKVAVGGGSIYLACGGYSFSPERFDGTHVERWDPTTFERVYRAPCARVRALAIRSPNDLYIGKDVGDPEDCTLERWDANTATPQWGVIVKGDYLSNDGPVFDSRMGVGEVSIAESGDLWVLAGDFDSAVQHWAYELRQYDTSGNRMSCQPAAPGTNPNRGVYQHVAAIGGGAFVSGLIPCETDDEIECDPEDGACTPVEPCPETCGTLSIHGKAVTAGCECREGIGDGCMSVNFEGCADLNPPANLPATFVYDPPVNTAPFLCDIKLAFLWRTIYSVEFVCDGVPRTFTITTSIGYACTEQGTELCELPPFTGWACIVEIDSDIPDFETITLRDFLAFPGCGNAAGSGPDFVRNAPIDLPACLSCGGDQAVSISLRDSCDTFMMMAPMMAAAEMHPARLMASIDGPAAAVGLILHDAGGEEWMDEGGILIFTESVATIGEDTGPVTILSRTPFLAVATVGPNEVYVTEEV